MKWYADNSELNGIRGAEIPDILLFGGIIIGADNEKYLQSQIEKIKAKYGSPVAPVKWNMKDLQKLYKARKQEDVYQKLLSNSREWRAEIFDCLNATDCALLVACIQGYSTNKKILIKTKENLSRYIFSNGLMRFGLHVKAKKPKHAQVILDWPDGKNSEPFDDEYASAYLNGKTADGVVSYNCGKLNSLTFVDSVLFTTMTNSSMLQVADLIVGATREFLECALGKKCETQGANCLKIVRTKFRGAPRIDDILKRGLVMPSGNVDFVEKVKLGIKEILYCQN